MSGRQTPRAHRKRLSTRKLVCLSLAVLICVLTGYLVAPYKHPSRDFPAAGPPEENVTLSPAPALNSIRSVSADDPELRHSEFCTNNCNSSEIYGRLWYDGRIRENSRLFQTDDADDSPYHDSIETNVVTKDFRVVIKVLAFNRLESLSRCLLSLAKADYGGDDVNLQIFVDHFSFESRSFPEEARTKRLLWSFFKRESASVPTAAEDEQTETDTHEETDTDAHEDDLVRKAMEMKSVDEQLAEAHEILNFVENFWWSHGTKQIHYRSQSVGLQAQWIESWWPADLDEFAFIVEDDMEVSNLYYRFLRTVIATYYYNPEQYDPSVYGVSLQRPRLVPGKGGLPLNVTSTTNLFRYPLIGTWGQLLFPRQWREFRLWYDAHKTKGERPILEGMVTNSWYKKLGEKIWTPWFVKFAHSRGYFNLYTNFSQERALSVSHREPGSSYKKAAGPDSRLIVTKDEGNDTMLWVMSPASSLPQFDFCFRSMKTWTPARALAELEPMLATMAMNGTILLVNLINVQNALVRNWLCHMDRLGLRSFVLLGDDIDDLARRGYATISTQMFTEVEISRRRDTIAVQVVHEILELGYNVWLTRADTVWVHNPFDVALHEIMSSQPLDQFHPALLYIQASQGSLWSKWVGNMSGVAASDRHWPGFPDFVNKDSRHYRPCRAASLDALQIFEL